MFSLLCFTILAQAQDGFLTTEEAFTQAQTSFSELSDISRNVTQKLEQANKEKDIEKIQCISARQLSIATLLEFSKKSVASLRQSSLSPLMAEADLEKIKVALKSANQYKDEVETCLASTVAQNTDQGSTLNFIFDDSQILSQLTTDEAEYGTSTIENNVSEMESSTGTTSSSGSLESESTAPPPASSPYQ
jgi:hypothetical protein